ncbi:MAG: nucleotide sugar dehydrogenase [Chloroflexi bacterium]|nr:nucleotide sugar dehydrogenase [Chloroflexota bacterium]
MSAASTPPPTGVIGLSHLGIVYGTAWASFGQPVIAVDADRQAVERLRSGDPIVLEPGLPELLEKARPYVTYTDDFSRLAECPLVIVARDIPTDEQNRSDIGAVQRLIDMAIPHLRQDSALVVMCQVPPGFNRKLGEQIRAQRPDLRVKNYYWVETLAFGWAVERAMQPERLIVSAEDPSAPLPPQLQAGLEQFGCPIVKMGFESAELTKTAINIYLIGAVTYANALADLCEAVGADWSEMVPALRLDRRIGQSAYIRPSLGVAGGNLERDLVTLRQLGATHDVETLYLDALQAANNSRFDWVHRKLTERLLARGGATGTVAIWGLTYKKDTKSTKNSPALRLLAEIDPRLTLKAWDPAVGLDEVRANGISTPLMVVKSRDAALDDADCLAIMADWDTFGQADLDAIRTRMRRPLVIDTVGVLQKRRAEMAGIEYVVMGR